jgi:biopolymer transport protein ExbB
LAGLIALGLVLMTITATSWAHPHEDESLFAAYKKEFAYLEAQKKALEERLQKLEKRERAQVGGAKGELDALQGRLLSLQTEADRLSDTLAEVERNADGMGEGGEAVATTVEQANATFEKWNRKVDIPEADGKKEYAKAVSALFDTGTELLEEHSSVRSKQGEFFLPDGTKTEGQIVMVGNVAAYGVADKAAGALAPAGNGRLKLWKKDASKSARALANGEHPGVVQAFLFESLEKAVEEQKEKTWLDIVNSGGVIAWVIVGLGLLGLLLVVGRVFILWRAGANTRGLIAQAGKLVVAGDVVGAKTLCENANGAAARVLTRTLSHLDVDPAKCDREELEDVVAESILHELPTLERFGSAILVFAAVAPLLGLLGTVTGMISTFDIITEFGTGDPKLLSGGISEALVTTQLGLIVAIPLLLIGNVLKGWAGNITTHMERGALRLMNLARLERQGEPDSEGEKPKLEEVEMPEATEYLGAV